MKKSIILLTSVILTLFSCKKNNGPNAPLSATINNAPFNCSNCIYFSNPNYSIFQIIGGGQIGHTEGAILISKPGITISSSVYKGIGVYPIDGIHTIASVDSLDDTTRRLHAVYGTLIITDTISHISGRFNFTTTDSTKVINGTFSAVNGATQ